MSDQEPKATGTKFSQFTVVEGDGVQGVGLKDGQNVRFNLTTDAVAVNPNPFRNARGQFAPTPQELENINNQRDVNEFLYGRIENIEAGEIPPGTIVSEDAPENPEEGLCWYDTGRLELFVYAEGAWLPCSPLGARVDAGEALQAEILSRVESGETAQETIKDRVSEAEGDINDLESKVKALEGAVGEHSLIFTGSNANVREGEFNLKDGAMQLTNALSSADYIGFSSTDRDGNAIDLDRITDGDVVRLSDISGQVAELKIDGGAEGLFSFTQISGDLDRLSELPYDFVLLSSFDPTGLATIDYVDDKDKYNAKKDKANTFKEVQTFQKTSYFQGAIVLNGKNTDTLTEVKGENEETRELWNKIRGTNKVSWICYPGQENRDYKRCMTMEWDQDSGKPKVFIDYLMDPVNNKHAANKQYVDKKVSEAGGGSFAQSGATTPELSTGELFFNTTDKILYIGE
jgi:hypothetical protein